VFGVQYGLLQFIGHDEAMTILCRFVDSRDPASMLEAMKLLAAVCLVPPDGLDSVTHIVQSVDRRFELAT